MEAIPIAGAEIYYERTFLSADEATTPSVWELNVYFVSKGKMELLRLRNGCPTGAC